MKSYGNSNGYSIEVQIIPKMNTCCRHTTDISVSARKNDGWMAEWIRSDLSLHKI